MGILNGVGERANKRTDETNEKKDERKHGLMDGRMNEWTKGIYKYTRALLFYRNATR